MIRKLRQHKLKLMNLPKRGTSMPLQYDAIVDISLELDPKNFGMRFLRKAAVRFAAAGF